MTSRQQPLETRDPRAGEARRRHDPRPLAIALAGLLAVVTWWIGSHDDDALPSPFGTSSSQHAGDGAITRVPESSLPSEARATLRLVDRGGPFPSSRDGVTFENRERLLPAEPRGHYREYTVPTPGSADRGARRLVVGGAPGAAPGDGTTYFYSDDHYRSFVEVVRG